MYILLRLTLIQQNTLLLIAVCKTIFTNYILVQSLPRYCNNTLEWKSCFFYDVHHVTDMLSGPVRRRLDLLIISVKQYVYSSKHLQKELSMDELVKKLTTQWKLEKCIQMQYYFFQHTFIGILVNKEQLKDKQHYYNISWISMQEFCSTFFINNTHEKLLDCDWLRAVQFKCNSSAKV